MLRDKGVWLGVIAGALGWILTLAVLARGGGYLVVVPRLAVVLPLAVVGTVTALAALGVGRPRLGVAAWLLVIVAFAFFWNFLIYWARFGGETWGLVLPLAHPTGIDFRDGLYEPARAFSTAASGWPPLTLLLGLPFTLLSFSAGHVVHVCVLVLLAAASVVLSAKLAAGVVGAPSASDEPAAGAAQTVPGPGATPSPRQVSALAVGLVAGLWLFTSYGFMYEIERGNIDLYALFFALLSVWLMLRSSRSPWWPALALAVSIDLKLYPGVLLVLLFWRYRWRAVVPVLVTNVALLLVGGPGNVLHTLSGQSTVQGNVVAFWWGNHSARALAHVLHAADGLPELPLYVLLLLVPLALWGLTMYLLVRRGWSQRTAVLAAAASVPVMSVVPSISHDYKLVLYVFPLAVLVAVAGAWSRRDLLVWSLLFGLLAWVLVQLSRSALVIAPAFLNSKYAMILLVQALLLYVSWRTGREPPVLQADGEALGATGGAEQRTLGGSPAGAAAGDEPEGAATPAGAAGTAAPGWGAWPARRTVCIVLLLLAAAFGANYWVGILHSTFDDTNSGIGVPQHDFFQYYAGGHNWRLGFDPYVNHPEAALRAIQHPRHDDPSISGYIYPPTLLPLFGALAEADYDTARTVWLALDVSAFALLILAAVSVSRGRRLEVLTAAVLLTVVSFPFFYHVHEGQIDMIVAALSVGAFLLYPRWKGWPSAALLAVAVVVKVSPVLLVAVIALYFRDWRFVLKVLACTAALLLASLLFVEPGLYREYLLKILPKISGSDPSPYNQTPLRFWWKYPAAVKIGSALGYAALLFLAWVAGRNSRRLPQAERRVDVRTERYALLLLAVVLMLLFSPLAWQMAYVWAIVPLALLLTAPPPRGREWALLLLAAGAALLSMRMWPYRVLDMTNMIGAAVAAVCLMLYYLPFERPQGGPEGEAGGPPAGGE